MAEVNIMMIAIYSSINLYAQLTIVAENHPKQTSPSFSAGAVPTIWFTMGIQKVVLFFDGSSDLLRSRYPVQKSTDLLLLIPAQRRVVALRRPYPKWRSLQLARKAENHAGK